MKTLLSALALTTTLAAAATPAFALQAWRGNQRAVVLLVEWQNAPAAVTRQELEATFFTVGPDSRSLRALFQENAQGAFDMTGDVRDWRTVARTWNPASGCDLGPIVDAAWRAFGADIDVPSYDSDGNGKIDNLFVVHSGRIGQDRVGPECTFVTDRRADFAIVFQSQGIGTVGNVVPIGFYVHEGGHGYYDLPDLYGDHYQGRYGIGMWGMMGLGAWAVRNDIPRDDLFRQPAHFEPLSKIRIGWVTPRVINTTTRRVLIRPVETTNDIVAVPVGGGVNFYLEYRSGVGFSTGHRGQGLLIWKNFALIQADGRDDLNNGNALGRRPLPPISENFGDGSDPFPGTDGVTSYAASGVRFEAIAQTAEGITLDIVLANEGVGYVEPSIETYLGPERL